MDIPRLYKYRYFNENMVPKDDLPNGQQIPQWHQVLYDGIIIPAAPETFNDPYDCDFLLEDGFLAESGTGGRDDLQILRCYIQTKPLVNPEILTV